MANILKTLFPPQLISIGLLFFFLLFVYLFVYLRIYFSKNKSYEDLKTTPMVKFLEFIDYLLSIVIGSKDAIMGGAVYFIYSHIYLKRELLSNFLEFIMGVIFAAYMGPQVSAYLEALSPSVVSFLCGLLGMTGMKLTLEFPWKETLNKLVSAVVDTFINKLKR